MRIDRSRITTKYFPLVKLASLTVRSVRWLLDPLITTIDLRSVPVGCLDQVLVVDGMGKPTCVPPRSEDGRRDTAELLHSQQNAFVRCPTCGFGDRQRGAFNKDVAGKADADGRRYRRFVCRSQPRCGKSLSVTDFISLCASLPPRGRQRTNQATTTTTTTTRHITGRPTIFLSSKIFPIFGP